MRLDADSGQALLDGIAEKAALRAANTQRFIEPCAGCILGTAVGDALGLPYEGIGPRRAARLFPDPARYHLLPFGRGLCSDDTEHTIMVAEALIATAGYSLAYRNADEFRRRMAWHLRFWIFGLPAGIGMATLKGILKLWLFVPRRWQGVDSAGNGPAMRSAVLGLFWGEEPDLLRAHVRDCTRLTHTDPKAQHAAQAVAQAAHVSRCNAGRGDPAAFAVQMHDLLGPEGGEMAALIERACVSVLAGQATVEFARALGLEKGVTGYALHTVPVALHAWLAHPGDYRGAVLAAIACGGDTDTVAAITGGIMGAGVGRAGIPPEWLDRLAEYPRNVAWMDRLASSLAQVRANYLGGNLGPVLTIGGYLALGLRNLGFLLVVLLHGLRRLLPPY